MDLLRTRSEPGPRTRTTAPPPCCTCTSPASPITWIRWTSKSLHRYTDRLHQVVYAAAGFYAGDLQVTRQFGLAIYFSGHNSAAARPSGLRPAPGWSGRKPGTGAADVLVHVHRHGDSPERTGRGGRQRYLSGPVHATHPGRAAGRLCQQATQNSAVSRPCEDVDIAGRLQRQVTEVRDYAMIEEFAGPYQDLLERQLRLILKRLTDPAAAEAAAQGSTSILSTFWKPRGSLLPRRPRSPR